MMKKELVFLEMLSWHSDKPLTQLGLSKKLKISLSTVNNAIKPLRLLGAIDIMPRQIKLIDKEKILMHWANARRLAKDIVYSTYVDLNVKEIESNIPSEIMFTAYSAFKFWFNDVPADYSEVLVYASDEVIDEIKKRFPYRKGPSNLIVLKANTWLMKKVSKNKAPKELVFVDLWNLKEWYARAFTDALKKELLI